MFVFGTADDVFAMAVRIEENGHAFYQGAAEKTDNPEVREIFERLAAMEAGHITAFKAMRARLAGSFPADAVWDPEGLAESYLQATADTHIFAADDAIGRLQGVDTPMKAFELAIQFEKDSVAFFVGMKHLLPDPATKGEIDQLIDSEVEHVRMLSRAQKHYEKTRTASIT